MSDDSFILSQTKMHAVKYTPKHLTIPLIHYCWLFWREDISPFCLWWLSYMSSFIFSIIFSNLENFECFALHREYCIQTIDIFLEWQNYTFCELKRTFIQIINTKHFYRIQNQRFNTRQTEFTWPIVLNEHQYMEVVTLFGMESLGKTTIYYGGPMWLFLIPVYSHLSGRKNYYEGKLIVPQRCNFNDKL